MGWPELYRLARAQYGVVTIADAVAAGLDPRTLRRRAAAEGWTRLHPGVWMVPGVRPTAVARTLAAVLATEGGVASGYSSLWLHGVVEQAPATPELLVPYGTRGPSAGQAVRVARTRWLPDEHCVRRRSIATTSVERAVLELSGRARVPDRRIRDLVIDGRRGGKLDLGVLERLCAEGRPGRPRLARLGRVLGEPGIGTSDSAWECEVREGVVGLGFDVHPGPFPYRCRDGVLVHLDVAVPGRWVCVECDGRAYHSDRRAFSTDRQRWTQISRDWQIVWVTWDRWMQDRAGVLADVRAACEAADEARPPARPAT